MSKLLRQYQFMENNKYEEIFQAVDNYIHK